MRNYQTLLVFAPTTDICYDNWQEHINKRYFNCGAIKALEELGYIETIKQFIGRKPNTSYIATESGEKAFKNHINALSELLNKLQK